MLTRIESRLVRQPEGSIHRAWYQSVSAEVVLHHDAATGAFLSLEMDWDHRGGRAYVEWNRGVGVRTGRVDTGEDGGGMGYKRSPVVSWDFRLRPELVEAARRLIEESSIEEGLRESILRKLKAES